MLADVLEAYRLKSVVVAGGYTSDDHQHSRNIPTGGLLESFCNVVLAPSCAAAGNVC